MKKTLNYLLIVTLLTAGLAVFFYPAASDFWNQMQQDKISVGYGKAVGGKTQEELEAERQKAQEYNKNLLKDEIIIDPFDQVQDRKVKGDYAKCLDPEGNGVMGMIEIPKINVYLPIYHGTSEDVLQKAIGHLEQTSLPVGGSGTHTVVSGHRGLPSAKLFTDLDRMEDGDVFYLHVLDETLAYEVDQITVVEPHNLEDLAIIKGEDHVTLVTCTPYSINSHRLLVRGTRIPYEEAQQEEAHQQKSIVGKTFDYLPYGVGIAAFLFILLLFLIRRRKKKK